MTQIILCLICVICFNPWFENQSRLPLPVEKPQYTKLGGLIYIHGHGAKSDWTLGCVALENEDMKELYDAVPIGTPVTIKP